MRAAFYEGKKGTDEWCERKKAFLRQGIVGGDQDIAEHLTEHATVKEFKPGHVIYEKGDRLKLLFFCFYGCIQLVGEPGDLDTRKPGTDFGGWPFTHPDKFPGYVVTAKARDESVVAEVSYSALDRLPKEKLKILKDNIDSKNAQYVHEGNLEKARLQREKASLEAELASLKADKEKGPKKPEPPDIATNPPERRFSGARSKLRNAILTGFNPASLGETLKDNDMLRPNIAHGPDFNSQVNSLIDVAREEGWLIELCSVLAAARLQNEPVRSAIIAVQKSLVDQAIRTGSSSRFPQEP
jgi:hypothetical protein